ncbi:uncharacterized protein [Antedon mediterranea]|uniref:uncharacterized protein n=1 Tax=Antedon mediterranea TaxID=105859 RepID=UPI003AF907B3
MALHGWLVDLCKENDLEIAREKTAEEIFHFIVSNNAVNIQDQDGTTALMFAAYVGNAAICHQLIDGGADINLQDKVGCSALHWAATRGHSACCNLLVDAGSDINIQDRNGSTPLMKAAYNGFHEVCLVLLNKGADANQQNKVLSHIVF